MKYRKKPVVIEAVRWLGKNFTEVDITFEIEGNFLDTLPGWKYVASTQCLEITTLEGVMTCQPGDYLIRGVKGEFYPCKPDIFEATYEKVEE